MATPKVAGNQNQLLSLAVKLITQTEDCRALDILKLLLQTADPDSFATEEEDAPFIPETAQKASYALLDHVLLHLQQHVYAASKDKANVPFLISMKVVSRIRKIC
jgi:sialic acid synthase SpsE